ncbi:MAG: PEP-CTERM sorting domain-containing protein [Desulfobacula sp.]|nr:PEP-CTERM sorting domain-containing protein [Desulfobacula sp.]
MTDTAGYLNGGSNNYENLYFNWTWRVTPDNDGYDNPGDNNHDNYMDDWLMHEDETVETDSHYISLSWDQQASIDAGAINFQLLDDAPYFSGYVHEWTNGAMITTDIITSASSGAPVPEPATMLLFGLGLLGLAGVNRRKK